MKKRVLISLILMIICIIATNKLWLIFKPMDVSFNAIGKGQPKIEVILNKKNDDKFEKVKSENIIINLDKNDKVKVLVRRSKSPKRLKIKISDYKNQSIILSNFSLRDGVLKINDLNNFTADGAKLKVENNMLVITPEQNSFSITYKTPLDVKANVIFDIKLFLIITILSFLLVYKLTSYIADFKSLKNQSAIDIIFLTVFFVLLFIPMLNMNTAEISKQENRVLAKWKPLIESGNINYNFGRDYNNWFSDRINSRKEMINLYYSLLGKDVGQNVLSGKSDWLFYKGENSINNFLNVDLFSDEDLSNIKDYLVNINNYCNSPHKKFYFVILPDKNKVYGEFYPKYIVKNIPDSQSRANQLINYLEKNTKIKSFYLYNDLISKKKDGLLYYKNDTHWNRLGAYYGYKEIMSELSKDFPNIKSVNITNFKKEQRLKGDLTEMLPASKQEENKTEYILPIISTISSKCLKKDKSEEEILYTNKNKKYSALLYRDSFTDNLIPYISETFAKSTYFWRYQITEEELKGYDIIILAITERELPMLLNLNLKKE